MTCTHRCNGPEPIVRAARAKIGGIVRTPVSVAITTDHTVPMITTNNIAPSVWPNQSNASGTQQTLGNVCKPRASTPIVSSTNVEDAVNNPSGKPIANPIKYPSNNRRNVTAVACNKVPSRNAPPRYSATLPGDGNKIGDQIFARTITLQIASSAMKNKIASDVRLMFAQALGLAGSFSTHGSIPPRAARSRYC